MKFVFLLSIISATTYLTVSTATASTGRLNCMVTSISAYGDDNDMYAEIACESEKMSILASSESVKTILMASKVSNIKVNISVSEDQAFLKSGTLHKIQRVELN